MSVKDSLWFAFKNRVGSGDSGGGSVLVVHGVPGADNAITLDKTWKEIKEALLSGAVVLVGEEGTDVVSVMLTQVSNIVVDEEPKYLVYFGANIVFTAADENEYPAIERDEPLG